MHLRSVVEVTIPEIFTMFDFADRFTVSHYLQSLKTGLQRNIQTTDF
jgi:hypothetical protein